MIICCKTKEYDKLKNSLLEIHYWILDAIMEKYLRIFQKKRMISGDGIDTILNTKIETPNYCLYPGHFPKDFVIEKKYDNITLLAVLEHIPLTELKNYPYLLSTYLLPKGRVIITVPTKKVDYILNLLIFIKLLTEWI